MRVQLLKAITNPLFLSIILTIIIIIFYFCMDNGAKFTIYTFVVIYLLIYLNNEYLFADFTEKID